MNSSNALPLEFQKSFIDRNEFPRNSVRKGINTYPSALAVFAKRFDAAAENLCQSRVDRVDVHFRDLKTNNGSGQNLDKRNIHSPQILTSWLGVNETRSDSPQSGGIEINATRKDPKCRFIYLHSDHSRARLNITRSMLAEILTFHQVMPDYLDYLLIFGLQNDGMQPKAVESVDLSRSKSLREDRGDREDRRRCSSVISVKDGRMSPTLPTIPQVVEPEEAASQQTGDHLSSTQPELMPLGRKHATQTKISSSRSLSGSNSYLSPDSLTTLPTTRKDSRGNGDDSRLPAILPPSFRREEIAIVQEYDKRYKSWSESWGLLGSLVNPRQEDKYISQYISNRDIVFVVDNAASMKDHWNDVTTTVLTLAMMIGTLDKDGLDLRFTLESDKNVLRAKGKKMLTRFEHSLSFVGKTIDHRNKTDMAMTLSRIFDNYKDYRKKQTLIVLTDGLWEGSNLSNDAANKITKFVGELRKHLGKHEPRWFSIQFVSFGDNKKALQRLKRLDDELGTVEDVVDTKPWTTDKVEQLILGSISQAEDAAQASSSRLQPMRPSPTPSRSSSLNQPKSPLKERAKIALRSLI